MHVKDYKTRAVKLLREDLALALRYPMDRVVF